MPLLFAFLCAFAMVFLIGVNTRLVARNGARWAIFTTTFTLNIVWGLGVGQVAQGSALVIICYAVGAGLGMVASTYVGKERSGHGH